MKTNFLKITLITFLSFALLGCKKKADEAKTTDAEEVAESTSVSSKYKVNTEASTIAWKGFKPTGTHNGTIALESGVMNAKDGAIESGTFLVDMKSIVVSDIPAEEEGNAKLTGHLKSADFFDVEAYPSAVFTVTGFETKDGKSMLSGNLKMKDTENNITIPVTVNETDNMLSIKSETFTIDRSKWNVRYGSKSFFDDLGDSFINDDIELQIEVVANKA